MLGGAEIFVRGQGMMDFATSNFPRYQFTGDMSSLAIDGNALTDDESFMSMPANGKLAISSPSLLELFAADWSDFDGRSSLSSGHADDIIYAKVQVTNSDFVDPLECSNDDSCKLKYKRLYTPILHDVVPNQVYADQRIDFWFDILDVHDTKITPDTYFPAQELSLNKDNCNWEGLMDHRLRLSKFDLGKLPAKVGSPNPTKSANVVTRFVSGHAVKRSTSKHCNYAGDDCWYVRIHPKIESISASSGSENGYQTLTITGQGLNGTDITVTADEIACDVQSATQTSLTCLTGAQPSPTASGNERPGQPGLVKTIYDPESGDKPAFDDFSGTVVEISASLVFESTDRFDELLDDVVNQDVLADDDFEDAVSVSTSTYLTKMDGWFKAPSDGQFRFYMSCDDECRLEFDETNDYASGNAYSLSNILETTSYMNFRNYFPRSGGSQKAEPLRSDYFTLSEGKYYRIRGQHRQDSGSSHFSVSVEVQNAALSNTAHPNSQREIQTFVIDQTQVPEEWFIEIANPTADGFWFLVFTNSDADTVYVPDDADDNYSFDVSASTLCYHMQRDYFRYMGSSISCTRVMKDELGDTLGDDEFSQAVLITFTIKLNKRITGNSFASVVETIGDSTATITFKYPANSDVEATESSAPLAGYFTITCQDPVTGEDFTTGNQHWAIGGEWLAYYMSIDIPFLSSAVIGFNGIPEGTDDDSQRWYWDNYRKITIEFVDYLGNVPQCTIQSATDTVENQLTGNSVTFSQSTIIEGGTHLFFEPIPMEMLYSSVTMPQVKITIDELEAACAEVNCDYEYVANSGEVTSQDLSGLDITIEGTSLPTEGQRIVFGGAACGTISGDATSLTCTLENAPYGSENGGTGHEIELYDVNGLVTRTGLTPIDVAVTVTAVSPDSGINQNGGDEMTITGTGFPNVASYVEVEFSDGTFCAVTSSTPTEIVCTIDGFDKDTLDTDDNMLFTIRNNAPDLGTRRRRNLMMILFPPSFPVTISAANPAVASVSPTTLSPVLKGELVFTLTDYSSTMVAGDFTVQMISTTVSTTTRLLNVISVDDGAKTLTVQFPGAASDIYVFQMSGSNGHIFCPGTVIIQTLMQLTDYSPKQGSTLGGTKLTLIGNHFGTVATDNPVKVGNNYCYVETTSDTEITCRIGDLASQSATSDALVLIFARTSEEMVCATTDEDCSFEYITPTATVSAVVTSFDTASDAIQVTVTGSGFGTNTSTTHLVIDGVEQTTVSVVDGSAVFQITDIVDTIPSSIAFYTMNGTPNDASIASSMNFTPVLVSISELLGSSGGEMLTVTGVGFGTSTETVNLFHTESAQNICASTEITGYGVFTCYTIAQEILSTDTLSLVVGDDTYACGNFFSSLCAYAALDASSPTISGVQIVDSTTLEFTGTNFVSAAESINCNMLGVTGTGVLSVGDTVVTCTFDKGVPVSDAAVTPTLVFVSNTGANEATALTGSQTVTNTAGSYTGQSGLSCSFAGGCLYNIEGTGLANTLSGDDANTIMFCDQECVLDLEASDADNAKCELPALITTFSAQTYDMAVAASISGTYTGSGSSSELLKLNDGLNLDDYNDSSNPCHFQLEAGDSYQFQVDEVKIFINNLLDTTPYVAQFKVQGSDESQEDWTTLITYDNDIHEGWNSVPAGDSPWSYNTFRFYGLDSGSCRVGEVKLMGIRVLKDTATSTSCTAKLTVDGTTTDMTSVTYDQSVTPYLDVITPRYGSEKGDEEVVFTGVGFTGTPTVFIDDRPCSVEEFTSTTITCSTANKPSSSITEEHPSLVISIAGVGKVATRGLKYQYVAKWSDTDTWGGDFIPGEGDAVEIPVGRALLYDVDSTPTLSFITVLGSLIFAPETDKTHQRYFDAQYVIVNGGYLEIGTEDFPYDSKLTITMHGDEYTPALPIYGNKVIAVRNGRLEMHGPERSHSWTELETTVEAGATSITLISAGSTELDWQIGEEIVIASTDFIGRHAEQRTITGVTDRDTNPVITFSTELLYKHYAGIETYGDDTLEMRAEVGLLSRNVKYRGDEATTALNQYGAHIMLASPGDESVIGKIENCEFFDVGQAFKLGRYPLHFHMIGTVTQSYIKNNAIHQTYNRGTTLHGVHYLTIQNNVIYKAMGHAVFVEDAVETKNLIDGNLVVDTRASNSLLNTDQTPASFWITHPDNIVRNNHAAGSDRYSYWYDLQGNSIGPSFDPNVCPQNSKLGEFRDNVAHSNGRYGLRIFHQLIPRTNPCKNLSLNRNSVSDPFGSNAPIIAEFHNLVSYKNGRNGAIAERVGAVQFHNFKVADNILAGIEISDAQYVALDEYTKIVGGLVVGKSANTESAVDSASPRGVIGPRSEWLRIEGTSFFNLDFGLAAALGDCSHCWHPASTDMGARTISTKALKFDEATVPRRIRYQYPFRGIYWDMDGSLTDLGANSWATPDWEHNRIDGLCSDSATLHNGLICDNTIQVRQIYFDGYSPNHFDNQDEFIMQLPLWKEEELKAETVAANEAKEEGEDDVNYFRDYIESNTEDHYLWMVKNIWAAPFVTNQRYTIRWGTGLDFEDMNMHLSERWTENDSEVFLHSTHIDVREEINFYDMDSGTQLTNMTYFDEKTSGVNYIYNDTATREFGWRASLKGQGFSDIRMEGIRCVSEDCDLEEIDDIPISDETKLWSLTTTWADGVVPTGGDVTVLPGENIIYDLEDSPIFDVVTVNGRLTFMDDVSLHPKLQLRAHHIFVRAGELLIGSEDAPYVAEAKIILYGARADAQVKMSGTVEAGNKIIANTNLVEFHGKKRSFMSRLRQPVYKSWTETLVDAGLDWVAGDEVYFAPTNMQPWHHEYKVIEEYITATGRLTITEPFEFYHFGEDASIADDFSGLDMRGEVLLLTRNIKVVGDETNDWGCTIVTSDRVEADRSVRTGTMILDNVEVYRGGQEDTYKSAIRYEGATRATTSEIEGSVAWGGNAKPLIIKTSHNINVKNSAFLGGYQVGIILQTVTNVHLDGIFLGDIKRRFTNVNLQTIDKEGGVAFCSFTKDKCFESSVQNSIVAGVIYGGFIAPGHQCGDTSSVTFKNNVAHSIAGSGAYIFPDPAISTSSTCYEGSHFSAYKCRDTPLSTHYQTKEVRMRDMIFVDNRKGVSIQIGQEGSDMKVRMSDSEIYGEVAGVNQDAPDGQSAWCEDKSGLMLFSVNQGGKPLHPTMPSALPIHKIKTNGVWGGNVELDNVNFNKWSSKTECGKPQHAIVRNQFSSDYIPMHEFKNTKFREVENNAVVFIEDPKASWANPTDCGEWPCTAPNNVILKFSGTQYTGVTRPVKTDSNFVIASDVPSATNAYSNCDTISAWNAAHCLNSRLGVLLFESLDADTSDRTIQPITISSEETGYKNTVNSMMDHIWDGFYTGQKRLSRFPVQIETDHHYLIKMAGTPPGKMRYTLRADGGWLTLRLYYPNAGAYQVYANGILQEETAWDTRIGGSGALTKKKGCGEWRFIGIQNFLEFYLTAECAIEVKPLDQIRTTVRLSWTLDEFYADGGTTTFTDRVAASLGIPAWRIKTVAVYEGSVIVEFFILSDPSLLDPQDELKDQGVSLQQQLINGQANWLGAPILDVDQDGEIIISSSGSDQGGSGTSTLIEDFLADRDAQTNDDSVSDPDSEGEKGDQTTVDTGSTDTTGVDKTTGGSSSNTQIDSNDSKSGQVVVNTDVTVDVTLTEEGIDENKFLTIILVVIVCVIVIVASFFLARLLLTRRQKKVIIDIAEAEGQADVTSREHKSIGKQLSQPHMDEQYVAENLDYLEMTKGKNRKAKISYESLPDQSVRSKSSHGPQATLGRNENDQGNAPSDSGQSQGVNREGDGNHNESSRNMNMQPQKSQEEERHEQSELPMIDQRRSVEKSTAKF